MALGVYKVNSISFRFFYEQELSTPAAWIVLTNSNTGYGIVCRTVYYLSHKIASWVGDMESIAFTQIHYLTIITTDKIKIVDRKS